MEDTKDRVQKTVKALFDEEKCKVDQATRDCEAKDQRLEYVEQQ